MGIKLSYAHGQTPLDENEIQGLLIKIRVRLLYDLNTESFLYTVSQTGMADMPDYAQIF
jgi:hypothetical protein